MAEKIKLHPVTPHTQKIFQISDQMNSGAIALLPTDSQYALACVYTNKKGTDRIRQIRHLDKDHLFTLICDSLSGISKFAKMSDDNFKIIKRLIPGPYTFVLPATKEVPKLLLNQKRKTIGFRVPDYAICQKLIQELGEPIIATTAKTPEMDDANLANLFKEDLFNALDKQVDIIIDHDQELDSNQSTVIDMTNDIPFIIRQGLGFDLVEEVFAQNNLSLQEVAV